MDRRLLSCSPPRLLASCRARMTSLIRRRLRSGGMAQKQDAMDALRAGVRGSTVVDLTVAVAQELPCAWPTHMPFQSKLYNYFADNPNQNQPTWGFRGPYHTAVLTIDEHCGTHIDAPSHFIPPPGSGLPNAGEIGTQTL